MSPSTMQRSKEIYLPRSVRISISSYRLTTERIRREKKRKIQQDTRRPKYTTRRREIGETMRAKIHTRINAAFRRSRKQTDQHWRWMQRLRALCQHRKATNVIQPMKNRIDPTTYHFISFQSLFYFLPHFWVLPYLSSLPESKLFVSVPSSSMSASSSVVGRSTIAQCSNAVSRPCFFIASVE